ncbi:MAG: FUSC family protein [Bryobacteraceae bacterium]
MSYLGLWRTLIRFDAATIAPRIALRNALGLALPLAIGVAAGSPGTSLVAGTGALNVSFSDGDDPYYSRARRMLAASLLVGFGVFAGSISGQDRWVAAVVSVVWAFGAAMLVALGAPVADLAVTSFVTFIVFSSQPMRWDRAVYSGLVAMGGGLLQTALALALWPVRRYYPQRQVLGELYGKLARTAAERAKTSEAPPATTEITNAQHAMATLARDHSVESERYLSLLNQAERIRLSLLALGRMRQRFEGEDEGREHAGILDRALQLCSHLLESIGDWLVSGSNPNPAPEKLNELENLAEEIRQARPLHDASFQMDALAGQIRSAMDLALHATPQGETAFARREARRPWALRIGGKLATLRANLTLQSVAFRHALRLAGCIAVSASLAGILGVQRSYWMPMTIAIVLKPDFTSTFSRGALRLAGTFVGLLCTTALFHFYPPGLAAKVVLVVAAFFAMRCFGPANYGIFVAALSALVVLLIAITGVDPKSVIAARGWNTAAGGALALFAYAVWPTWERHQVSEALANMLDAYFRYFQIIAESYQTPDHSPAAHLARVRLAARLARSDAETSVDRVGLEPGATEERMKFLSAMLASSHRFVHAVMALEAGLLSSPSVPAREGFRRFTWDVELTLHSLAAALRGSPLSPGDLPNLRQDHRALIRSGDEKTERYALVNVETDRLTNSLNTLGEQVLRWVG